MKPDYKKQNWMKQVESLIIAKLPALQGQFTTLKIWETLQYLYSKGESAVAAANKIINQFSK